MDEMRRARDWQRHQRRTQRLCIAIFLGGLLIWVIFIVLMVLRAGDAEEIYKSFFVLWLYALLATFADKLVVDFTVISISLPAISDDIRNGRWELIALTPLSARHYVLGKLIARQWLGWRTVALSMTFRVTVLAIGGLHIFILPLFFTIRNFQNTALLEEFYRRMLDNPPESVFRYTIYFASAIGAAGVYCIEPRWRLRVLTASTLAVSARGQDMTVSLLTSLLVLARVWVSQILFAITGMMMLLMTVWITALVYTFSQSDFLFTLVVPLYVFLLSAYIRAVYNGLVERSITRAYREMQKRGGTP